MLNKIEATRWQAVLQACQVKPKVAADWASHFEKFFQGQVFSSGKVELVPFLANVLHESNRLEKVEENLRYTTAKRLTEVWPRRFPTMGSATPFLNNPRKLAEKVYGGRLGNKVEGQAFDYRGSGLIMITGLDNFLFVEKQTGLPIVTNPDLLRRPGIEALAVALAWWEGKVPDHVIGDTVRTRTRVNGGTIGLEDVQKLTATLGSLL